MQFLQSITRAKERQRIWIEHRTKITRIGIGVSVALVLIFLYLLLANSSLGHPKREIDDDDDDGIVVKSQTFDGKGTSSDAQLIDGIQSSLEKLGEDDSKAKRARAKLETFFNKDERDVNEATAEGEEEMQEPKAKTKSQADEAAIVVPPASDVNDAADIVPIQPLNKVEQSLLEEAQERDGPPRAGTEIPLDLNPFSQESRDKISAFTLSQNAADAAAAIAKVESFAAIAQAGELEDRAAVPAGTDAAGTNITITVLNPMDEAARTRAESFSELDELEQRAAKSYLARNYTKRASKKKYQAGIVNSEGTFESAVELPDHQDRSLSNLTVVWDFGACGCTGWFVEAMNLVLSLKNSIGKLGIIAGENCFCPGIAKEKIEMLEQMRQENMHEWQIDVFVSHKPPQRYPHFPYRGVVKLDHEPLFIVGRSMTEVHRIPRTWVDQIHKLVDEVWIPSGFSLNAFTSAGVNASQIKIIPEPIDQALFNPFNTKSLATTPQFQNKLKKFNFLSIFKLEPRKGWKTLIRAFMEEFSAEESVTLFLHTYLFNDPDPRNEKKIMKRIKQYVSTLTFPGRDLIAKPLPFDNLHILSDETETSEMPRLYKTFQAFVLPTHGEGWGLPLMEAMAMGLPTVATNWGGQLDFMNNENSYLLPVEKFEAAEGGDFERGAKWAVPSLTTLKLVMRHLVEHREHTLPLAARGRSDVIDSYNTHAVAERILERLDELQPIIQARREARAANQPILRSFQTSNPKSVHDPSINSGLRARRGGADEELLRLEAEKDEKELQKVAKESKESGWKPETEPEPEAIAPDELSEPEPDTSSPAAPATDSAKPKKTGAGFGREFVPDSIDLSSSKFQTAKIRLKKGGAGFGNEDHRAPLTASVQNAASRPSEGQLIASVQPTPAQASIESGNPAVSPMSSDAIRAATVLPPPTFPTEADNVSLDENAPFVSAGTVRPDTDKRSGALNVARTETDHLENPHDQGFAEGHAHVHKPLKFVKARTRPTGSLNNVASKLPDRPSGVVSVLHETESLGANIIPSPSAPVPKKDKKKKTKKHHKKPKVDPSPNTKATQVEVEAPAPKKESEDDVTLPRASERKIEDEEQEKQRLIDEERHQQAAEEKLKQQALASKQHEEALKSQQELKEEQARVDEYQKKRRELQKERREMLWAQEQKRIEAAKALDEANRLEEEKRAFEEEKKKFEEEKKAEDERIEAQRVESEKQEEARRQFEEEKAKTEAEMVQRARTAEDKRLAELQQRQAERRKREEQEAERLAAQQARAAEAARLQEKLQQEEAAARRAKREAAVAEQETVARKARREAAIASSRQQQQQQRLSRVAEITEDEESPVIVQKPRQSYRGRPLPVAEEAVVEINDQATSEDEPLSRLMPPTSFADDDMSIESLNAELEAMKANKKRMPHRRVRHDEDESASSSVVVDVADVSEETSRRSSKHRPVSRYSSESSSRHSRKKKSRRSTEDDEE